MLDFFETLRSFYVSGKFCDVEIVSCSTVGDDGSISAAEKVRCHSLVLCSAVPSILPVFDNNKTGEDSETVILVGAVPGEDGQVSLKGVVDSIYDCLAGLAEPDPVSW